MIGPPRRWHCVDCHEFADHYLVTAALWEGLGLRYTDCMCLACLEKRVPRPLTLDDFTPARINDGVRLGYRMAQT